MPLALGLVWIELRLVSQLLIEPNRPSPIPVDFARAAPRGRGHRGQHQPELKQTTEATG
jgi:hypothetical protein